MWWQRHLSEFVTLFFVINPFAVLPVFVTIVAKLEPSLQRKVAWRATVVAFAVLAFFEFAGTFLLGQMGVPIRAFQIAGGIVLFLIALEMIRGQNHDSPDQDVRSVMAIAVYPLAIPKIAGPGAMLTIILLSDDDRFDLVGKTTTVGMLALVLAIQFVVLLAAAPIIRVIGTTGANVIGRVMGMLLAALAVGMVLTAVGDWLNLPKL